ncbi:BaiN/RdsA family NAD(P)/FAD-dependent oxidoreductase [Roseobacter sinensis]|uniref:Aminoacetone oxidase family FAD-binding enzyme n=1 Tax=Roseobacter sinensis TaxID=2931391 RepID=A0ABT3BKL4_9RHOB|nr:aminoacetone oxidase family FAD-binding enzyme [Roseobacter sp. WL0113]MCV3273894.1 aminoacetone oxidase family FAD-binding enzyme [Roseobacter sp. WL0113]
MQVDTAIIGAGAAGMMCAAHAAGRILIVDHAKAPGEKIRISGGGRCNFTNLHCAPHAFLSGNPHFAKSALARYSQWDFIELVERHRIAWHEKTLGQLFCDGSAKEIIAMLRTLMQQNGVELHLQTTAHGFAKSPDGFRFTLTKDGATQEVLARTLVMATGGKSIPKMGATGLAYEVATQFGLTVTETRPALVPFTFPQKRFAGLAGVATPARVTTGAQSFEEALLFTHRGLSGPAVLQASSYWREGDEIAIDLSPTADLLRLLKTRRATAGKRNLTTELAAHLPARLVEHLAADLELSGNLADQPDRRLGEICAHLANWRLKPSGTEGYRTAEVTLGGIETDALSAKTMETKTIPGLFFIGEAVDVTGWLGGYNFQWAWSSAMAAARSLST